MKKITFILLIIGLIICSTLTLFSNIQYVNSQYNDDL